MASYIRRRKFLATLRCGGVAARDARAAAGDAGDRVSEQSATVARPYCLLYKGQDVVASNAATPPSRHTDLKSDSDGADCAGRVKVGH